MIAGRAAETEALIGLWRSALGAEGRSLTLVGDAGVGKTALLMHLADLATSDGGYVVYVDGVRGEESIPYGALGRIVQQMVGRAAGDASRNTDVLARVTDLSPDGSERHAVDTTEVALSVLARVDVVAAEQPLLLVVDDLQWVDPETAAVVRFLARRLIGRRVALAIAARELAGLDLPDVVPLDGLGPDDTMILLADLVGADQMSATVARRLVRGSSGNPARLHRMLTSLTAPQRCGVDPLPDPLPEAPAEHPDGSLSSRLPPAALRAVAALAVSGDSETSLADLVQVAECTLADIVPAEHIALVDTHGSVVMWRDERHRTLAYWSVTAPERRILHARWAEVAPDRTVRTLHRARAAVGADRDLARSCAVLAADAARRGDHAAALEFHLHARSLQPDAIGRAASSIDAAESAVAVGDLTAARSLVESTADVGDRPDLMGRRLAVQAALAEAALDLGTAVERWSTSIRLVQSGSPRSAAQGLVRACLALLRQSQMSHALELLDDLAPTLELEPLEAIQLDIERGVAEISSGRIDTTTIARVGRYEELMALSDDELVPLLDVVAGAVAVPLAHFRQHEAALAVADRCDRIAAERDLVTIAPVTATARCLTAFRSDLPGAAMYGALAVELADAIGCPHLATMAESYLLAAEAHLGSPDTLAHIARLAARTDPTQALAAGIATSGYWLTMGDHRRALEAASAIDVPVTATLVLSSRWLSDLGEAAARCDRPDLARSAVQRMRALDGFDTDDWLIGAAARIEGMLADIDQCGDHFAASIAAFEASTNSLAIARSELLWGERLRRARRRGAARPHLERARTLFADVGAGRWTERVERELEAAGGGVSRDHSRDAERVLTPQELQVARSAVGGASYREIAGRLFVSPRTVETHLSAVYRKLGVRNRAELAALAAQDPALRPSP